MGLAAASDEEFVEAIYRNLLFRAPDPEGREHMLKRLRAGENRLSIIDIVLQSPEFDAFRRPMGFAPPGHFYSPHPGRAEIEAHRRFDWDPARIPAVDLREAGQLELLESLAEHYGEVPFGNAPSEAARYGYHNPAYGHADAIILFTMIQHLRPRRIVEVGSGHSSCAILDAVDRLRAGTQFTMVEPYAALVKRLLRPGDLQRCTLHEKGLQEMPLALFESLEPNDILFIDSSHVSKLGSDVNYLVFEMLPAVKPGVFVHIHDIFHPFEYPVEWYQEGRAWNEAYMLRAFLEFNEAWRIELFSTLMLRRHAAWFERRMPLALRNAGGHLWLSRRR